ncbi:MAG: hypothetical protein H6621_01515 [Halobacteriovoraceae bacterium]|nr:hypothetical protein [Halobacteriovoraceae bacterium]
MKNFILLFILIFSPFVHADEFCKNIFDGEKAKFFGLLQARYFDLETSVDNLYSIVFKHNINEKTQAVNGLNIEIMTMIENLYNARMISENDKIKYLNKLDFIKLNELKILDSLIHSEIENFFEINNQVVSNIWEYLNKMNFPEGSIELFKSDELNNPISLVSNSIENLKIKIHIEELLEIKGDNSLLVFLRRIKRVLPHSLNTFVIDPSTFLLHYSGYYDPQNFSTTLGELGVIENFLNGRIGDHVIFHELKHALHREKDLRGIPNAYSFMIMAPTGGIFEPPNVTSAANNVITIPNEFIAGLLEEGENFLEKFFQKKLKEIHLDEAPQSLTEYRQKLSIGYDRNVSFEEFYNYSKDLVKELESAKQPDDKFFVRVIQNIKFLNDMQDSIPYHILNFKTLLDSLGPHNYLNYIHIEVFHKTMFVMNDKTFLRLPILFEIDESMNAYQVFERARTDYYKTLPTFMKIVENSDYKRLNELTEKLTPEELFTDSEFKSLIYKVFRFVTLVNNELIPSN